VIASDRRPDPSKGIFETLLVVEGRPVELEAHLERLAHSLESIYAQALPAHAESTLRRTAEELSLGRLRLTAMPGEDGPRLDLLAGGVESGAVFPDQGVKLRTYRLNGGLGSHKWSHRPGIERPAPGEAGALIADGAEILEAGWANVFAVRKGTLWTPPLDGRLLPGTTRAALLALAAEAEFPTREAPLHSTDLLAAEETFLTGSIRGIEAALALDGKPLAGLGPLSRRLAAALRQRWGLPGAADDLQAPATAPPAGQPAR
jgi:para-aminobenzoate synthetase / 4-amino-4-deoxychorismate lyase